MIQGTSETSACQADRITDSPWPGIGPARMVGSRPVLHCIITTTSKTGEDETVLPESAMESHGNVGSNGSR